ncbi:hypothetical protein Esti_001568 [Eimeria stiedai]
MRPEHHDCLLLQLPLRGQLGVAATAGWNEAPEAAELHAGPAQQTDSLSPAAAEQLMHDWRSHWNSRGEGPEEGATLGEEGGRMLDEPDGRRCCKKKKVDSDREEEEKEDSVEMERGGKRAASAAESSDSSHDTETNDSDWSSIARGRKAVRGTKATLWGSVLLLLALVRLSVGGEEGKEHKEVGSLPRHPRRNQDQPEALSPRDNNLMLAGFGLGLVASGLLEVLATNGTKQRGTKGKKGARRGGGGPRVRGLSVLLLSALLSCLLPKQQQQQQEREDLDDDEVDSLRPFAVSTAKLSFALGIALAGIALLLGTATLRLDYYLKHGGSVASFFGMRRT